MVIEFWCQREMWHLQLTEFNLDITEEEDGRGRVELWRCHGGGRAGSK